MASIPLMTQSAAARRFHPARLLALDDVGGSLTRMTVGVAPEIARTYSSPGQYVEVRIERATGFFVLANEPGAARWEFVMRPGGGASDVLLVAATGTALELTSAIGTGFPLDEVRGSPLIIALGGTGIAAGRPLLARRVSDGDAGRTHVFVGARNRTEFGMRRDVETWSAAGVRVLVCLSHDATPVEGIPCANGYVQDVLRASTAAFSGSRIFAVGAHAMIDALRSLSSELGITADRVHTNY